MIKDFAWLMFFHLLADYPLQGDYLATTKGKNPISLLSHAGIWTGMIVYCLVFILGYNVNYGIVIFLFLGHLVDYFKAVNFGVYNKLDSYTGLLTDQLFHIFQLIVALAMAQMI